MKIIESGHIYVLDQLDLPKPLEPASLSCITPPPDVKLIFVNREEGRKHPGTQTQEVIRALIDRTQHCHRCLPSFVNEQIIHHLRMALVLHESRALYRKVEKGLLVPESTETGEDGHFKL